uniref:Uncharacterized protein n=1 Tax=uncultured marine virus TaxID=186617 RepID=A0A0F7L443_9VIRU|nr:hypothetical protein [uncultured marine virus]
MAPRRGLGAVRLHIRRDELLEPCRVVRCIHQTISSGRRHRSSWISPVESPRIFMTVQTSPLYVIWSPGCGLSIPRVALFSMLKIASANGSVAPTNSS